MNTLGHFLRQFRDDEDGVMAVELMLVIPMLVWALLSTLVYFDAYRAESISTRAGLTLADVISRERDSIDDVYLNNMQNLLKVLTDSDPDPDLRVTVYRYQASNDRYILVWSEERGMGIKLSNADLQTMRGRLPVMANGGKAILVETRTQYSAPFSIGMGPFLATRLDDLEFNSFTVITPRFMDTICYDPSPMSPASGDEKC